MKKIKLLLLAVLSVLVMCAVCGCSKEKKSNDAKEVYGVYLVDGSLCYYVSNKDVFVEVNDTTMTLVITIVLVIINSSICAAVGSGLMEKCGLSGGKGGALGFFLGELGLCICIGDCIQAINYTTGKLAYDVDVFVDKVVPENGWKCSCGKAHPSYVGTCSCGKSKYENNL